MRSDPPALFTYAITPTSVPYRNAGDSPQTVDLTITVLNPTLGPVRCSRLVFVLPVGSGGSDLTATPAVGTEPGLGVKWSITSDGQGTLTAMPKAPVTGLDLGGSIAFSVTGVQVNTLPGLTEIEVWEQTDTRRTTQLEVSKVPPGLAITSLAANPVQVGAGDTVTIAWATTGATTCTLLWDGLVTPVPPTGTYPISLDATTTVTLNATAESTISQQVTVYVPQVTILSLAAAPARVAQDSPTTLTWLTNNADTATIFPGDIPVDPGAGQHEVFPHESGAYFLTARGFGRSVSMPAPVEVKAVTIDSFYASPSQVPPGGLLPATLSWNTSWATACAIEPELGAVAVSGQKPVTPAATTAYLLQPTGLDARTSTTTVTVCPAITLLEFAISPAFRQLTMSWSASGTDLTTAVTLAFGSGSAQPVPVSGSTPLTWPWYATATLTCSGGGYESVFEISLPGQSRGVAVSSLALQCSYGLNAPGALATLHWATKGAVVDGAVVSGGATTPLAGDSDSVVFGVSGDPTTWTTTFGFGAAADQCFVITASRVTTTSTT